MGILPATLVKLAEADVFRSIDLDRRESLWEVFAKENPEAIFKGTEIANKKEELAIKLPKMSSSEHIVHDYAAMSLSLKAHPVSFLREKLKQLHIFSTSDLKNQENGKEIKVAGLVLVRQRPGTAKGVVFMTIEDETGFANLVIFQNVFEEFRKEILQAKLIMAEGHLQIEGQVVHLIVHRLYNMTKLLQALTKSNAEDLPILTLARPDEKSAPIVKDDKVFPGGRNFK